MFFQNMSYTFLIKHLDHKKLNQSKRKENERKINQGFEKRFFSGKGNEITFTPILIEHLLDSCVMLTCVLRALYVSEQVKLVCNKE